jgi:hypothetical protein
VDYKTNLPSSRNNWKQNLEGHCLSNILTDKINNIELDRKGIGLTLMHWHITAPTSPLRK